MFNKFIFTSFHFIAFLIELKVLNWSYTRLKLVLIELPKTTIPTSVGAWRENDAIQPQVN